MPNLLSLMTLVMESILGDVVLESHDFMGLWFPHDLTSKEHVRSNLQFNEFTARLQTRRRIRRMISKRSKSIPNWESECEVEKLWVSSQTTTKQSKLETHLLLGLRDRFQKSSTYSSFSDGSCRALIKNNEGNWEKQWQGKKTIPNTEKHGL